MPIGNKAYPVKKGVTNGYPTHVPNGDGGMYGDYTKDSYPVAGERQLRGALNDYDQSTWKYPEPTKGRI